MPAPKRRKEPAVSAGEENLHDRKIDDIFRKTRRQKQLPRLISKVHERKPTEPSSTKAPSKRKKQEKPKQAGSKTKGVPRESEAQPPLDRAATRKYHSQVTHDSCKYAVGDSAYVILDADATDENVEEYEVCEICEKTSKKVGRKEVPLLECEQCLRGYHLDCLSPPLPAVPKGEWFCQYCAAGEPLPPRKTMPKIARERYFSGKWGLVKIEALFTEPNGDQQFSGRWYHRPEDTHTGRQKHHGAREVFLTDTVDNNDLDCLERVVPVCLPSTAYLHDTDPDMFICEYEYDIAWKRFRKINEEVEQADVDWDGSTSSKSSDDEEYEEDDSAKPIYAFWAEKGLIQPKNMRQGARRSQPNKAKAANRARKAKLQGGEEWQNKGNKQLNFSLGASQIPERLRQAEGTDLSKARRLLALSSAPRSLACREQERDTIANFVRETVQAGSESLGQCLYVSGVPGTGKTATVLDVMKSIKKEVDAKTLPAFQFAEMNSLRLPSPQHAYTQIYEALTGQHLSPGVALTRLEAMFDGKSGTQKSKTMTVILADEIDMLVTRNQQVLYNLFEWPTRPGSGLALIAVANTMDLPERLLPRIASRLGGRRLAFQPYNRPQLTIIVEQRLKDAELTHTFAANAINMACSKVAGVSGDVRRVLQLCRKAAEICEQEQSAQVGMRHINLAVEEMFSAAHMQTLLNCCPLEKLVLAALILETKAQGRCDAVVEDVVFRLQQLAEVRSLPGVTYGDCVACLRQLGARRLILTEQGGKRLGMRISLNVPQDDVIESLQRDAHTPWLKDLNY